MGKVVGGCRVQTYYPITPAADESEYLEAHEILKTKTDQEAIIVIQTEDEIAAVNSASGACLTGARAATSTSGPGFSLMAEGLGWAGNNEVPVVITYYQRGGPSTGQPTRHSQQDLRFAMHAAHGEFTRIILASGDIKECFYDAAEVFNLAEKYQVPVIHLLDKAMANCSQTYPVFNYGNVKVDRGLIVGEKELEGKEYKRFRFTETGVSPRAFLGTKNAVQWCTGDEHNESGNINEEPFIRKQMMEKRMKKLDLIDKEVPMDLKVNFFGDKDSENIVVSWGSPKGAIIESLNQLKEEGLSLGLHSSAHDSSASLCLHQTDASGQKTNNRRGRQLYRPARRHNHRVHNHQTQLLHPQIHGKTNDDYRSLPSTESDFNRQSPRTAGAYAWLINQQTTKPAFTWTGVLAAETSESQAQCRWRLPT